MLQIAAQHPRRRRKCCRRGAARTCRCNTVTPAARRIRSRADMARGWALRTSSAVVLPWSAGCGWECSLRAAALLSADNVQHREWERM